jgi:hypothetical protein
MATITDKIKEDLVPALISGSLGALGYSFVFGQSLSDPVPLLGMYLPGGLAVGGVVGASHLVGNVLQDQVLSMIPSNSYLTAEGGLIKPILGGASTYGLFRLNGLDPGFVNGFGLGAVSVVGGTYAYDKFWK